MSVTYYSFQKDVQKFNALNAYLKQHLADYSSFNYSGTTLDICTTVPLEQEAYDAMVALVEAYTDPLKFYIEDHVESIGMRSMRVMGPMTLDAPVQNLIWDAKKNVNSDSVLDSIKTLIVVRRNNLDTVALPEQCLATVKIFDMTRNVLVAEEEVDVTEEVTAVLATEQYIEVTKSCQFYNLGDKYDMNQDCKWQFLMNLNFDNIKVGIDNLQKIYYIIE